MSERDQPPETKALDAEIDALVSDLSLEEKVYMMSGHGFYDRFFGEENRQFGLRAYQAGGGNERLGLEPLKFTDGPRGVRIKAPTTCFPVSMARGASWDVDLERRIGEAIGVESRALGITLSGAVCINLLRHPAWGRAQETYGEDPYLLGEFGAALTTGIQNHNVMATVKHFAANSMENARFKVDVRMSERVLREVYLPHFKRVIDAGCASVMSAYNKVNGHYCGHNRHLLRDILKEEWGFDGFVHSDWVKGVYGPDAAEAGLDIENPEALFFGVNLVEAVKQGTVSQASIDDAVRRILKTQVRFQRRPDSRAYQPSDVVCADHVALAKEAAEKSITLLKNDGALPLERSSVRRIAVIGALADSPNLGDHGSSKVTPPYVVTLLEGLRDYVGQSVDIRVEDGTDIDAAVAAAAWADVTLVIAGYTFEDEGEFIPGNEAMEGLDSEHAMPTRGGDRSRLTLRPDEEELIVHVARACSTTIVGIISGSAVIMEAWRSEPSAILMLWYPGMEGGTALARLLFGDVSPSGKLPFSIPTSEEQLPFFDRDADAIDYDMYHGYTKLDRDGAEPAFPFGFGLSYATFSYDQLAVEMRDGTAHVSVEVKNVGDRAADEVVQLYVGFEHCAIDRPLKLLRGFCRLPLEPGVVATATFQIKPSDLAWYDDSLPGWRVEGARYTACVGGSSKDAEGRSIEFHVPASVIN